MKRSYRVAAGDWIVLYAAAGGVGLIAAQWARELGVRVIGVVGTRGEARARARRAAASTCCSTATTFRGACASSRAAACPSSTIRSAARRSINRSIACGRTALLVSFGNSSGKVEPFGLQELTKRGSLYVTRPTLYDFIRERGALEAGAAELFALVERGTIAIDVNQTYALRDAAQAHRDLEARRTTGCTVLIP